MEKASISAQQKQRICPPAKYYQFLNKLILAELWRISIEKTSKQQLHSQGKPSTDLFFALSMSAHV